jgi:phosphatidylglycerophosphate synthase
MKSSSKPVNQEDDNEEVECIEGPSKKRCCHRMNLARTGQAGNTTVTHPHHPWKQFLRAVIYHGSVAPRKQRAGLSLKEGINSALERFDVRTMWPSTVTAMANALTAVRLLLVIPFAVFMTYGDLRHAVFALLTIVVALATDFLDGPIARRTGTTSALGRTFDHTSDFLFVTCGLSAGALRGAFPWILPILIAAAFAQYVIDSYLVHGLSSLRKSQLGRYNGILYFVPLFMDILIRMGLHFLHPLLTLLVWVLVLSTLVSIGQRLMFKRVLKELPSRPPEK